MSKLFLKRNSSTILTCVGAVGVIATSVLAVKATPKAVDILEEATKQKGDELTNFEKVKAAGPVYIPAAVTGAATIACIFGTNILNKRHQAALMSAYALVDTSFKEYKKKLKELYGEETHQNIVNHIAAEKAGQVYITADYMFGSCDLSTEENDGSPKLFYIEQDNRYFEATIETVLTAEYHLNRNYSLRGYTVLNEFYDFLGLEQTKNGEIMGWIPTDEGEYWIEFDHRKVVMEDGLECYIIEMPFEPRVGFDQGFILG